MEQIGFQWQDYLVLAVMLSLSAAIGFYYACTGGKQRTTKEYLLADKNMHWFPVACSLLASYTSSQTLVGIPGEIYTFGTIYLLGFIVKPFGVIIGASVFLPIFRELKVLSVFKYLELRYGKKLKYMAFTASVLGSMLYTSLVIYGPALSLSAVTGINIWLAILCVALISVIYTVLGGLKAVLWTDTVQLCIMLVGVFFVLIKGTIEAGGFTAVWETSKLSGRLDMLEPAKITDFDPRMRHTLWGVSISGVLAYANVYGYSQTSVQRALSLRNQNHIKYAYGLTALGTALFGISCGYGGLLIFTLYKLCDPIKEGVVFTKDQLYPLFVMRLLRNLPGLSGLILSSIFSASLSTVSSTLTSVSTVVLQEVVRPCRPNITDKQATIATKFIALGLAAITFALVLFARYFGSGILSMGITFTAIFGSPILGVFLMGSTIPMINEKGAIIGFIIGAAYGAWIGFGTLVSRPYTYKYPTTDAGCNVTDINMLTNMSSPVYDPSTWNPQSHYRTGISAMYDISYMWTSSGSVLVTIIFSLIFSLILAKKSDKLVSKKLIAPVVVNSCCLPKLWRDAIDFEDHDADEDGEQDIPEASSSTEKLGHDNDTTKF